MKSKKKSVVATFSVDRRVKIQLQKAADAAGMTPNGLAALFLKRRLMGDLAEYSQLVEESPATVVAHLIRRELQERKMASIYEEKPTLPFGS